jgi:preprotein translocase subunit SecB
VPCIEKPKAERPLLIQNSGNCLSAREISNNFTVEVATINQITDIAQKQSWLIRDNGAIVHKDVNKCLFRSQQGTLGLCGCDEPQVGLWDVDFQTGLYRERASKQVLFMDQKSVVFRDNNEAYKSSELGAKWATYELIPRVEYKEPTLIKVRPSSSDILSIQQAGMFLIAQMGEQQALTLTATTQPPELQFQSWVITQNGKLKNTQFNQCLSIQPSNAQQTLMFVPCDAQNAGVWEFVSDSGVIREQTLNQCISLDGEKIMVTPFSPNSITNQQKWETYSASKLSADNNGGTTVSSATTLMKSITPILLGALAVLVHLM